MVRLEIVTPEAKTFSDNVDSVVIPGVEGELGVLPMHAPLMTLLEPGELRVMKNGEETRLAVGEGFVEVTQEKIAVLTDMAVKESDIDESAAEAAIKLPYLSRPDIKEGDECRSGYTARSAADVRASSSREGPSNRIASALCAFSRDSSTRCAILGQAARSIRGSGPARNPLNARPASAAASSGSRSATTTATPEDSSTRSRWKAARSAGDIRRRVSSVPSSDMP